MKQYLIALSLAYGLTACEYEDGKDGVNGINGADGQSCEIVNDGELQCGEDVIAIRGEKGEQGQKGDDGVSCKIETNQDGDFVVCGDQSVRIPPETSEQSACTSEKLENGNHLITCDGESIEVPGPGSITEIIELAMTPVALVSSNVSVDEKKVTSTLDFNVPVVLAKDSLKAYGSKLSKTGPKSVKVVSELGDSSLTDWSLSIPGSVFQNTYYSKSTASIETMLSIREYKYSEIVSTLLFESNPYTLCESAFAIPTLNQARDLGDQSSPILLSLLNQKAFDTATRSVVDLQSTDEVLVYCLR
ncbi:MAG: hypothetical protein HRU19_29805 [Pseudobacteriovorax sp.]|nr:hypothetical protein [Pseudobacteriovorax sp.]